MSLRPASVDRDVGASHVAGIRARQHRDHAGDLGRFAPASQGDLARTPLPQLRIHGRSIDGLAISARIVTAQFGIGFPQVNDHDTEVSILRSLTYPGNLETRLSYIGRLMYEQADGKLHLAISGAQANVGYDPGNNDALQPGSFRFSPLILSAQYNAERWSITSEYALRHFRWKDFGNHPAFRQSVTGESFYLQGVYRFYPGWEAVLRYDLLFTNRKDRSGKKFAASTGYLYPAHNQYARDLTVGLRWNITPAIMLSTEYHRINGTAWLSPLDNPDMTDTEKNWNLFAIQASYRF